jgi:hypothetical protein
MNEPSFYQPPIISSSTDSAHSTDSNHPPEFPESHRPEFTEIQPNDSQIVFTTDSTSPNETSHPHELIMKKEHFPIIIIPNIDQSLSNIQESSSNPTYNNNTLQINSPFTADYSKPPLSNKNSFEQLDIHDDGDSFTDSEDEVPQSIQFETNRLLPHTEPLRQFTNRFINPNTPFQRSQPFRQTSQQAGLTSWQDVKHLDTFLKNVYNYYSGKGFWGIVLSDVTNLMFFQLTNSNVAFIVFITTFVTNCISHEKIVARNYNVQNLNSTYSPKRLADIIECKPMGWFTFIFLMTFVSLWAATLIKLVLDIPQLLEMRYFFTNVFLVSDNQLETLPWSDLCNRIIESRNQQLSNSRITSSLLIPPLDAHTIANKILKKDNFMIALLNKQILNLSVPKIGYGPILTLLMEWNINYCIFAWVFDEKGTLKKRFLKENNRSRLISQ